VRWTVGDANPKTIEALERSIRSVHLAFGGAACAAVCVHSVAIEAVRERVRLTRKAMVSWLQIDHDVPVFVRRRVDLSMADGLAWRFAPLRVFSGCSEVLLDAECIVAPFARQLWRWAAAPGQRRCLVTRRSEYSPSRHSIAVRGVPASFDLEDALEITLSRGPELLASAEDVIDAELEALSYGAAPVVVDARAGAACHSQGVASLNPAG
jgi:hypothetical protein